MARKKEQVFRIRRHATIGATAAEQDREFLSECFVDTGDLDILADTTDPRRVVLGRTGAGKTALLDRLLATQEHAVGIDPDALALQFLSDNGLLRFYEEQGVKMDLFYQLLWRHVFVVELIKSKYRDTVPRDGKKKWWQTILAQIFGGDSAKQRALGYLSEWGDTIWEDTDFRVREVITKFERAIRGRIGLGNTLVGAEISGQANATQEQKAELLYHGQQVVDAIQMKQLSDLVRVLAEDVFDDPQDQYYLVIDRLDEFWVDDILRYRLIRALIETVRTFQTVRNCKIIIALRQDLIDRVFKHTRGAGFQQEKYDSLFLSLSWSRKELVEILDKRVGFMVRHQYTGKPVTHADLLPPKVDGQRTGGFIVDRSLYRPRDVIMFFNCCLQVGTNQSKLSLKLLRAAEADYSDGRLRSLGDEWIDEYPNLLPFALAFLRGLPASFCSHVKTTEEWGELLLGFATEANQSIDELIRLARDAMLPSKLPVEDAVKRVFRIFHRTGLIGLKVASYEGVNWTFRNGRPIVLTEFDAGTGIHICPAFYRVLGTNPKK